MNVTIATLQNDILTCLQSVTQLSTIYLYAAKPNDLQSQVNQALGGLKVTNGKSGAAIEISKPFLVDPDPSAPGPTCSVEVRFTIKVQPTINNGANGTGLSCEIISTYLIQAMLHWGPEGAVSNVFYPFGAFNSPAHFDDAPAIEGRVVTLRAKISFTPLPRTTQPNESVTSLTVTLTNQDPDPAAAVLYTTDGTAPGYVQGTTTPAGTSNNYGAPFAVASGTVVRAIAISSTKLPSIIITFTVT